MNNEMAMDALPIMAPVFRSHRAGVRLRAHPGWSNPLARWWSRACTWSFRWAERCRATGYQGISAVAL